MTEAESVEDHAYNRGIVAAAAHLKRMADQYPENASVLDQAAKFVLHLMRPVEEQGEERMCG